MISSFLGIVMRMKAYLNDVYIALEIVFRRLFYYYVLELNADYKVMINNILNALQLL